MPSEDYLLGHTTEEASLGKQHLPNRRPKSCSGRQAPAQEAWSGSSRRTRRSTRLTRPRQLHRAGLGPYAHGL